MLPARLRKPLTCQLRISGETYLGHQIEVGLDNRILIIRHPEVIYWSPCQITASQGAQHLTVWPGEGCFDQDFHLGPGAHGQGGPGCATQPKPTTQCD